MVRKLKKRKLFGITILALLISYSALHAAEIVIIASDAPKLPSVAYKDAITDALAEKMNVQIKYVRVPFARRLEYLKSGEVDMSLGLLRSPERERWIRYIEPPYQTRTNKVFFVRTGKKHSIRSYDDLYGKKIGILCQADAFERFDRDDQLIKEEVSSHELNFRKLIYGRIDTAVLTDSTGYELIKKLGLKDQVEQALFGYKKENSVYLGVSRKSVWDAKQKQIQNAFLELKENGRIDEIIIQYYSERDMPVPEYR